VAVFVKSQFLRCLLVGTNREPGMNRYDYGFKGVNDSLGSGENKISFSPLGILISSSGHIILFWCSTVFRIVVHTFSETQHF
jgi:hypothetical protein